MAPVASLPPHSSIAPRTRISDLGRNQRDGSALCKLWGLAFARATCDVFVLGVWTARNKDLIRTQIVVGSVPVSGLRQNTGRRTLYQQQGGK
jgi:hypothetical protein